jgi:hypothetical protein
MMFDRATLEAALSELGELALAAGKRIDLAIYGGSALALAFDYRRATKDVDAVLMTEPEFVRRAIAKIADERDWPEDWLNDAVKGFLSEHQELTLHRSYPSAASPGLRVFVPSPRYLLGMKCMAMRIGGVEQSQDIQDIRHLIASLEMTSAEQVLEVVASFYPAKRISPKTVFGVQSLFESDDSSGVLANTAQ